jgi:chromate transporter
MVAVAWQLARSSIIDPVTAILALIATVLLIRSNVNSAWLVLGGAVVGIVAKLALG